MVIRMNSTKQEKRRIKEFENWSTRPRGMVEERSLVHVPPWYGSTRTTGVCWRESFLEKFEFIYLA